MGGLNFSSLICANHSEIHTTVSMLCTGTAEMGLDNCASLSSQGGNTAVFSQGAANAEFKPWAPL